MDRNWTGKLQVILPFAYFSWKNFCSHTLKASSEEVTQQTFVLMKTSWSRLPSSSSEDVFITSSRRLDEDEHICLSHTSSENVFKTSLRRFQGVFKTSCKNVFKISSRRLQDILKTCSRHLQDVMPRRLQYAFKTSCKNLFKTSSRCLQDVLERYL